MTALAILLASTCFVPILALVANIKMLRMLRRFADLDPTPPPRWPKLSIIIPACNEAETIEPALAKMRLLDYPELELVLIDDRSKDATGAIMDRVAAEDPRFRVIHVEKLPEGWLGKVHALKLGTESSTGEILLFTDADVLLAKDALTDHPPGPHGIEHRLSQGGRPPRAHHPPPRFEAP